MEFQDDDYPVIVYKLLSTAYEKYKKGERYSIEEINKFGLEYRQDLWQDVFEIVYEEKRYLKEIIKEDGIYLRTSGYEITKKGIVYLFNDPVMIKLREDLGEKY